MYSFRYVWGGPELVGVMAQDLLKLRPDAVVATDSGYLKVDYEKIDVKMMTLQACTETPKACGVTSAHPIGGNKLEANKNYNP
jgi:hypothetical protein